MGRLRDDLRRDPERLCAMLVWLEYEEPQIRRTLIEECGIEPEQAERLYREAKETYDAEEAAEDDVASAISAMRPLAEVALTEQERDYDRAVAEEHFIHERSTT